MYFLLIGVSFLQAKDILSLGSNVKEYDNIFEKISERRTGADNLKIDRLANPFVVTSDSIPVDGNDTVETPLYVLDATFDQKAKINGQWYMKNDKVEAFTLVKVTRDSVILQNENEKKEIFIRTKDDNNIKIFFK